jgi:hypothetical protein
VIWQRFGDGGLAHTVLSSAETSCPRCLSSAAA